jgi:hypothetical protein
MELVGVLSTAEDDVLQEASGALRRSHLTHYEATGSEESYLRLKDLFALVLECLRQRALIAISQYAQRIAQERFHAGFGIAEVQTAFNALEEAIWHVVIPGLPTQDLVESAGLIGTILGAGKDTLAREWVSLATSERVPSLDLTELFEGAAS